jgi:very-short-patch-repair endonuclease
MRTLLDLGEIYPEELVERSLDKLHRQGWIELTRFAAYLERPEHRAVPGSGRLREMVAARTSGRPIGSDLESILFPAMRKIRMPLPVTQHPVGTPNGVRYIDYAYPDAKLAIELEGFEQHGLDRATFEDDRDRFNDLRDLGWEFRQFTWKTTTADPVAVAIRIARAIGLQPCRWKRA